MKNSSVKFNHEDKTIILTKDFAKRASIPGSDEYKYLMSLKRDNRDYSVIIKHASKKASGTSKLTLSKMEAYISKHDADGTLMEQFNKMRYEEKGENLIRTSFFTIKKWFYEQYPDLKKDVA